MKLLVLINEADYREAITASIAKADSDIYIEIHDSKESMVQSINANPDLHDAMILTDMEEDVMDSMLKRTVFLVDSNLEDNIDINHITEEKVIPNKLFKYKAVSRIIADLKWYYFLWTGIPGSEVSDSLRVSVFSDAADIAMCREFSLILARQIAYYRDAAVLYFPLTYINEPSSDNQEERGYFKKLVYNIKLKRDFPIDTFFYKDNYGIYYFRNMGRLNPIVYMDNEAYAEITDYITGNYFDAVVFDIENAYSANALHTINTTENLVWIYSGVNREITEGILLKGNRAELTEINTDTNELETELISENFVRSICGIKKI